MRTLFLPLVLLLTACPPGEVVGDTDTGDTDEVPVDADGDGFTADEDCDDTDGDVFPGADEVCNEVDDDCDEDVDEDAVDAFPAFTDADDDGFGDPGTEVLVCTLAEDQVEGAGDCDDTDGTINPEATEVCDPDDVDEDCDGLADDLDDDTDDATKTVFHVDADEDGYGDPTRTVLACDPSTTRTLDDTDCDDSDPLQNPDLGCDDRWDGLWDGTLDITVSVPSLGVSESCSATGTLEIDAEVSPALTTTEAWDCVGPEANGPVTIEGDFVTADRIDAVMDLDGESFDMVIRLSEADGLSAKGSESRTIEGIAFTIDHDLVASPR